MLLIYLLKGILVGIVIAVPAGPVGVLCIRRTIFHGRLAGFISGLGAASADAMFGIIAAMFGPINSVTVTPAIMPGMITMNGTNIFGNEPMIGVRWAADMLLDAIARWTSTKFVVQ